MTETLATCVLEILSNKLLETPQTVTQILPVMEE